MSDRSQPRPFTLRELATQLGGRCVGDETKRVTAVRSLAEAGADAISFALTGKYLEAAGASKAGALLVDEAAAADPRLAGRELVVAEPVNVAMARLIELMHPARPPAPGVHPTAVLGEGCEVDPTAHVGPYAVLGAGSRLGAGAVVHAHAVVGRDCSLGDGVVLHPQVVLYDDVELHAGVVVHAGTVIGADGFGYATHAGIHHKVPQVGRVVVERDVEIGANAAIDRATLGETRLGTGTKVDNLVQVGHNVRTGRACILCGQAGIAGSTTLGAGVVLGGQAGVADHLEIGDGVQVAGKSALFESVEGGARAGIPAIELGLWRRQSAALKRLGEMLRRLRALEKKSAKPFETPPETPLEIPGQEE